MGTQRQSNVPFGEIIGILGDWVKLDFLTMWEWPRYDSPIRKH